MVNRDDELKMESGRSRQTSQSKQSAEVAGGCIRGSVFSPNPCAERSQIPEARKTGEREEIRQE